MKTNKWINLIGSIALIATMTGCDGEDGGVNDDTINNDNNTNTEMATRVTVSSNDYFVTELSKNLNESTGLDNYAIELENGFQSYEEFYNKKLTCVLNIKYGIDTYLNDMYLTDFNNIASGAGTITDTITERPTADNIADLIVKWGWDREVKTPACDIVLLTGFDNNNLNSPSSDLRIEEEELLNRAKIVSAYYKSQGAEIAMYKTDYDYFNYIQVVPEVSLLMTNKNNIKDYYLDFRISNRYKNFKHDLETLTTVIDADQDFLDNFTLSELTIIGDEWSGTYTNTIYNPETSIVMPDIVFIEEPGFITTN